MRLATAKTSIRVILSREEHCILSGACHRQHMAVQCQSKYYFFKKLVKLCTLSFNAIRNVSDALLRNILEIMLIVVLISMPFEVIVSDIVRNCIVLIDFVTLQKRY